MCNSPSQGASLGQNPLATNPYYPSQNAGAVQAGNPLLGGNNGQAGTSGAMGSVNPMQMQQLQALLKSIMGQQSPGSQIASAPNILSGQPAGIASPYGGGQNV